MTLLRSTLRPTPPGLMATGLWCRGFGSTSKYRIVAINSQTELMKGEINQTDEDTSAAFTCEYLGQTSAAGGERPETGGRGGSVSQVWAWH